MLENLDHRIFMLVYGGDAQGGVPMLMVGLTMIGSGWSILAFLPMLTVPRMRRFAAYLCGTLIANAPVVYFVKMLVRRPRPFVTIHHVLPLFGGPTDFSFPSGHAAGSFCFSVFVATVLLARKPRRWRDVLAAAGVMAVAAGIAVSRVYLGVHFPGDVTAGALIGGAIGYVGARAYLPSKRTNKRDGSRLPDTHTNGPSAEGPIPPSTPPPTPPDGVVAQGQTL